MITPTGNNLDGIVKSLLANLTGNIPITTVSPEHRPEYDQSEYDKLRAMGVDTAPVQSDLAPIQTPIQKFAPILEKINEGDLPTARALWQQLSDADREVIWELKRGDPTLQPLLARLENTGKQSIF
jgi:hypothetical protein